MPGSAIGSIPMLSISLESFARDNGGVNGRISAPNNGGNGEF